MIFKNLRRKLLERKIEEVEFRLKQIPFNYPTRMDYFNKYCDLTKEYREKFGREYHNKYIKY